MAQILAAQLQPPRLVSLRLMAALLCTRGPDPAPGRGKEGRALCKEEKNSGVPFSLVRISFIFASRRGGLTGPSGSCREPTQIVTILMVGVLVTLSKTALGPSPGTSWGDRASGSAPRACLRAPTNPSLQPLGLRGIRRMPEEPGPYRPWVAQFESYTPESLCRCQMQSLGARDGDRPWISKYYSLVSQ